MIHRLAHVLQRRRHPERFALLAQLRHNETLSRDQLLAKRQRDLNAIVEHAMRSTAFYREKYRGIAPLPAGGHEVARLPILRKEEVMRQRDAMVDAAFDRGRLKVGHTGGSTGRPLAYYYDDAKHVLMRAGMCRSYMWSGWRPGQRILNFWGARQDLKGHGGWRRRLDDFVAAERTVGAYEFTESRLHAWAQAIRAYRPVLLQGYASILAELARFVVETRLEMPRTLLGVYSTAEVLYDRQRALMEQAFRCKVFNQYGSREIPNIAVECRHGNQHVFTDMVYLESVREAGEERLVVTSLTNRVMPFIRYDIGDVGRLREGDCPCGSPFPLMQMGHCRSNDLIRTPAGKRVYPSYFIHLLDGLSGIRQYQFVQREPDRITLNVVSSAPLPSAVQEQLRRRVRAEVDEGMGLAIHHVDAIGRTASGKHRFVICQLP